MRFNRALLLLPLLAACATPEGEYPSLDIRPAERASGTLQPPPAPAPYVPPPTPAPVLDRLEQLAADAASAHRAFLAEAPAARSAVAAASGAELGSDGWARASVAVAGLEGTRSRAMIALADLDRLMVDAAVEGTELDRIVAVRNTVIAQVDEQNATIETLSRSLR
jgi:hypothetical protein